MAGFDKVDPAVKCLYGRATGGEPLAGQRVAAAPTLNIVENPRTLRWTRKLYRP
jgi:hypothetical protein